MPILWNGLLSLALLLVVADAEQAFAATMAARDLDAFAAFLADDAIFLNGDEVLRGHEAIVSAWSRYFTGERAPFSWEPDRFEAVESSVGWRIVFDRGCPVCAEL